MHRQGLATLGLLAVALGGPASAQSLDNVFLGCLHSHTRFSDGLGTPTEAFQAAKSAGLDFFAVTEHNHRLCEQGAKPPRNDGIMIATNHALYSGPGGQSVIESARALTENGTFVALYGQEFSTISKGNHINVFDVDEVIDDREVPNGDFKALVAWLGTHRASNGKPALVQFNHPFFRARDHYEKEYGKDDFGGDANWIRTMGRFARTIEVLNGPGLAEGAVGVPPEEVAEAQYIKFLDLGFHLAPTGDQDNHFKNWGVETNARTGIIADALTKEALLAAVDARHVFATEDKDLKILFQVNGHLCGDILTDLPSFGDELDVRCSIKDEDEPHASYQVDVFSGTVRGPGASPRGSAAIIDTFHLEGNTSDKALQGIPFSGTNQYLFFRVTQILEGEEGAEPDRAWTAPIWFEVARPSPDDTATLPPVAASDVTAPPSPPANPSAEPEDVAQLVASKHSGSYHLSLQCLDAQRIKPANLIRGAAARQGRTLHPGCPRTAP